MQALIKIILPLGIVVALLTYLFGGGPEVPALQAPSETLAVVPPTVNAPAGENRLEEEQEVYATPVATQSPIPRASVAQERVDGVSRAEQEQITREVQIKFEDLIYYDELPTVEEERYKYLMDSFSTSLFYLNEVAAKNIEATPENLAKAMRFLALYATQSNASEIDDSIRIIATENPARYQEALMDLNESEAMMIKEVIDNLESELNHAPMEQ